MGVHDLLAFSPEQQAAVIGHALVAPDMWERLDLLRVKREWLVDANLANVWDRAQKFRERYGKPPASPAELLADTHDEPAYVRALERDLARCERARGGLDQENLHSKLLVWAKSRILYNRITESAKLHNEGKMAEAFKVAAETADELDRIEAEASDQADTWLNSGQRVDMEEVGRLAEEGKLLSYGNARLDDALYGILPTDLILLGARSGSGKTQMAKNIARHNARLRKRVKIFALEAEEHELERREKFEIMAQWFLADHPDVERTIIEYPAWRMNKLNHLLGPYSKRASEYFASEYATQKTYYRTRGDFGIHDLRKQLYRHRDTTDLFVLDHLHYVDLDGKDENQEMGALVKSLRHIALGTKVPILVIVHLRKPKTHVLCPGLDEIHGSSNIFKVATTAITMANANEVSSADPDATHCYPTFIRIVKNRLAADRLYSVGVSWYNPQAGDYLDKYAIGKFNFAETEWQELDKKPSWAVRSTIEGAKMQD